MEAYTLTQTEREVFEEMTRLNPGTTMEMIFKTCIHNEKMYKFHYFADRNRPPLVDISPLARLQGLKEIQLYSCNVRDLSPLAKIPSLQYITISGGPETLPCDFTPLQNLCVLHFHMTPRCRVPNLSGLPALQAVSLTGVDSLDSLAGLKSLKSLRLGEDSDVSDLSSLASCPNLEDLSVVGAAVHDLTPLTGHPSLRQIILSDTKVTDVSPLATIPTLEMIWLYGTKVQDVSCLAALPRLNDLNLRKTQVTDLSAFQGREHILIIERKKLGIKRAGKSSDEIKAAIEEIQARLDRLGVTPRTPLKRDAVHAFQEKTGVKLPKEYVAFLTKIGDGFEIKFKNFIYYFPPLAEVWYDPTCIKKRFSHTEGWCWEDDENATGRKIAAATSNGQIELVDCGCGQSYRLIVCGGAKGEVWDMADVGISPYGNGLDFLDWMKDFLDGKVMG